MLTPSYLRHAPEMAEEIAEELHVELMNRIVERILHRFRRGDPYILTAQDKFQLETLQESGFLLEDLQREIARRTGRMQDEIAAAMEDAGVRTLEYDDSIYRAAGYYPAPLVHSPYLMQLMERSYRATAGEWNNFTRTTANAAQQTFVRACDKAYHLSMTGAVSPTQAIREALKEVIRDGIYVQYPTGHRDTIETATARAVRTGISQASAQIQLTRMDEFGVGLVLVSSHLGARPAHQVWQGKVYDRSGKHPAYPDFIRSTGYGQVDGLCGANCRHHISPYFEGQHNPFTQYDSEENQKQYDIEQRQRAMERRIRDTKRQTMNWKTAMDKETDPAKQAEFAAEYQRKAALLKKQNAAYRDYCAATGQKTRPERLEIARWNRSQAAKAAAAAKQQSASQKNGKNSIPMQKIGKASGKVGDTDGYTVIDEMIPFDFSDQEKIRKEINHFLDTYADAEVEHSVVISPNGFLYRLTGTRGNVNPEIIGIDALKDSIGAHNHPVWHDWGLEYGDAFSVDDVAFAVKHRTGTEYLTTGDKRFAFRYTGSLSEDEIKEMYEDAKFEAAAIAFDEDIVLDYPQEAAMRILSERLEGFEFYEDI